MSVIHATVRNGRIETDQPIDLPEGTKLVISQTENGLESDEGWDNSPEGIADWLNWYDSLQPLTFTPEERAAWNADREFRKEWEKSRFDERTEKLKRLWQ